MWNRYSVMRRYRRPQPEYPFERAITFDPKILQEFPDAIFLGVDVESLLDDAEVSSPATRVPV
jgi:hypothetical protein